MDGEPDAEKPRALTVVKFDQHTESGAAAVGALSSLDEEGVLHGLMSSTLREDRAPMGNICRAIQSALRKE